MSQEHWIVITMALTVLTVLTVLTAWLVLSALATAACALVARGGLREDGRRGRLDGQLTRLVLRDEDPWDAGPVPAPRSRSFLG